LRIRRGRGGGRKGGRRNHRPERREKRRRGAPGVGGLVSVGSEGIKTFEGGIVLSRPIHFREKTKKKKVQRGFLVNQDQIEKKRKRGEIRKKRKRDRRSSPDRADRGVREGKGEKGKEKNRIKRREDYASLSS